MIAGFFIPAFSYAAPSDIQKASIQQQMDQLQKDIDNLDNQLGETRGKKETLARELSIIDIEYKKRQLEIKQLSLEIAQTEADIGQKNQTISTLQKKIITIRENLRANVMTLYKESSASLIEALLSYSSLSQFFSSQNNLENIQAEIKNALSDMRVMKSSAETARDELQQYKEQEGQLKSLREVERRVIAQNSKEKSELLKLTKGKEALFQSILSQKKKNLASLKSQLFYLERTGVSAEDALKFAELAAKRAGIRTEFLLALLEVETGRQYADQVITAGTHIGTGNWRTDLYNCYVNLGKPSTAEKQKTAFFSITEELGFDPDKMPVSRKYSNGAGCGGAMGPAQFLPSTWLLFENRVSKLTGHKPANPWNIEDAFTASAIYLADAGATTKTEAGEQRAARAYISGRPTCPAKGGARTICLRYSSQILSLTKSIARDIN